MHKNRKPVLVLWNRCTEKIKYEYRKIYSSTLNMKYKAWCPLPIKESSKMWIELLNFPATFILTSDFRISCHYKLSLSLILISVASASARRSLPNTVHQYVPHG